jgi:Icc-related predicted phosphoesterase
MWFDCNHENHDAIDNLTKIHGKANPIPTPSEWLQYIPRGCRFNYNGYTLMGFGGAWSVDWDKRELGETWWKQETITQDEVDALDDEPVDILISHEAPFGKEISYKDEIITSIIQRELMLEIQNKVNPAFHICGHHHTRATWESGVTRVHVLGRDEMGEESVLFLNLPAFSEEETEVE